MKEQSAATGPLRGVRVVEFAGIGPGPFASMLLSDMGADVVSIARPGQGKRDVRGFGNRGRRVGALDSFRAGNGETVSPLNLVGDYGGGALYLVVGVLAAVIEARTSGKGQVVDAAMCDGVSSMLTMFHSMKAIGRWTDQPRTNLL